MCMCHLFEDFHELIKISPPGCIYRSILADYETKYERI